MPNAFDFSSSPFDCLDSAEQRVVRDSVDIAYFRADEVLLEPGIEPAYLFVVIKGHVAQFDGDELVSTFGPGDCFDGRSLVAGRASSRFVAAEEVVAYQLAKAAVNELISRNATFGALLFSDLSIKLGALSQRHSQREMQALTQSRVAEAFLRPAQVVDGGTDIVGVAKVMQAQTISSVLVRDGARLGIFTNTGLQRAIVDGRPLNALPVRELATFKLVTIAPDAPLFDALALMIEHQVHRLVVADKSVPPLMGNFMHANRDEVILRAAAVLSVKIRGDENQAVGLHAVVDVGLDDGKRLVGIRRELERVNADCLHRRV